MRSNEQKLLRQLTVDLKGEADFEIITNGRTNHTVMIYCEEGSVTETGTDLKDVIKDCQRKFKKEFPNPTRKITNSGDGY